MSKKKIIQILNKNDRFLISTHVSPDPDALSSELTIALYLKSKGKKVSIINEESVPKRFRFLPRSNMVKKMSKKKVNYDVAIVVDCGELDRIGKVKGLLDPKKPLVNIDHHITNDQFGTLNLVEPKASSTAEVLYTLLKENRFKMTDDIANLVYMGIMTDTGSFRYENTTPLTHAIASELLKFKVKPTQLYKILYESVPFNDLKLFTKIVNSFDSFQRGKVICVELQKRLVSRFSQDFDLRDKIFKFLRTIKGVEVILIFTEYKPMITRVNLRSQGKTNVAKLAHYFKGGGHKKASGCTIDGNMKTAKRSLLKQLKTILK